MDVDIEAKLKALKQNLEEDFQIFLGRFEDMWYQLEQTTHVQDGNYFKLIGFMEVLHPKVPATYEHAMVEARRRSWKIKQKMGQLVSPMVNQISLVVLPVGDFERGKDMACLA